MSNPAGDFPAASSSSSPYLSSQHHFPTITADPTIPLRNLTAVQTRIDAVRKLLSNSVNGQTFVGNQQLQFASTEISSAIQQIIVNGAALIACAATPPPAQIPLPSTTQNTNNPSCKLEITEEINSDEWEIMELDSDELLAEYVHFCEICGKGFKRDANLRMHMRAHGNQFKTPEALAKPEKFLDLGMKKIVFSCPLMGCNRNKSHKKFKPMKSIVCVKSHFKRSHCPKMYSCNRCNKKSFSVMADLRGHLKHCGETRWKCSCGTSFSRKDKLFGHVALFEGHMPAVMEEEKGKEVVMAVGDDEEEEDEVGMNVSDNGSLDGLIAEYGSIEDFCLEDMLNSPGGNGLGTDMDGFFNF